MRVSGLPVIALDSESAPGRADVIVRLTHMSSDVLIETFSARTHKPLTTGRASFMTWGAVYRDVANHLMNEFAPQKGLYKQLAAEKEGGNSVAAAAVASSPSAWKIIRRFRGPSTPRATPAP